MQELSHNLDHLARGRIDESSDRASCVFQVRSVVFLRRVGNENACDFESDEREMIEPTPPFCINLILLIEFRTFEVFLYVSEVSERIQT